MAKAGGRLKRFGSYVADYIKLVYTDYTNVAKQTVKDAADHPFRATWYTTLIGGLLYSWHTNPDERSFRIKLIQNTNDLLAVSHLVRNPNSDRHMQMLAQAVNHDELRRLNLGICSVMYLKDYGSDVDLYAAHCKSVSWRWWQFKDQIVDVGMWNYWFRLTSMMSEYDVNPEEWS
ncbi:mitochondrial import inner membrane translocase subunit Tim29 [Lingula anatina]|uniref:Mitochondrial import inner membrane translocase subunit Tim29 n=1 Tax=Lingula anatina TaxID=7574 RepID=A0A1S3JWQ4_LINAN|nr:mitochondrial import inner membrane translocase subunit Tim29 [Lingula anatina]|eukprot:XP_013414491.1 mitochondrial import inner membrane translocase subunit Tim29 [Lingula anatina]